MENNKGVKKRKKIIFIFIFLKVIYSKQETYIKFRLLSFYKKEIHSLL